MNTTTFARQCIQEVIDLHAFFQAWLRGETPNSDAVFRRFAAATAPQFTLISPNGQSAGFEETADWIRRAHGTRVGVLLWTDDQIIRHVGQTTALLTYREWQSLNEATTLRISSALFQRAPNAPNGVVWLHVHETWLDQQT